MPQISNFYVQDVIDPTQPGQLLPIEFKPLRHENGVVHYRSVDWYDSEKANVGPLVSVSNVVPTKSNQLQKTRFKVVLPVPVIDAVGEPTNVRDHELIADLTFSTPQRAKALSRRVLISVLLGLLSRVGNDSPGNGNFANSVIVDGETFY